MKIKIDGQTYEVEVRPGEVVVDGKPVAAKASRRGSEATVEVGGKSRKVELKGDTVVVDGKSYAVVIESAAPPTPQPAAAPRPAPAAARAVTPPPAEPAAKAAQPTGGTVMRSPMPGKILRVVAKEGAKVAFGDTLLVLEAMKMENEIRATAAGTVKSLPVAAGATVGAGDVLAVIE
jgi:glutaconyl-CoA/methylmalonyl-CoA decarboxylase subunit gamma